MSGAPQPAPPRATGQQVRTRGGPLAMLALLVLGWCGARAMWSDYPPLAPLPVGDAAAAAALGGGAGAGAGTAAGMAMPGAAMAAFARYVPQPDPVSAWVAPPQVYLAQSYPAQVGGGRWQAASSRDPVVMAAVRQPAVIWLPGDLPDYALPPGDPARLAAAAQAAAPPAARVPAAAPFQPPGALVAAAPQGRWSLDGWTFWRQGSDSAAVSQGRVPVYGASQAGAVLQYRIRPASGHDPRIYVRAYSAQVQGGESEIALGLSARPLGSVPLRIAGEARYTDAAFFSAVRPAGYIVTELAPFRLPLGMQGEAYGQAGWVGGPGATWFADGQASALRPVGFVSRLSVNALRLSLGAGVWGGAQKDAQRLDIGPTMRIDMKVGKIPTRVGVDWRRRIAGDASPGSGLAVTVSTGF